MPLCQLGSEFKFSDAWLICNWRGIEGDTWE